jgi:hypothetical protein
MEGVSLIGICDEWFRRAAELGLVSFAGTARGSFTPMEIMFDDKLF